MKIGVVGSMQYTELMLEARDKLKQLGHDAFVTRLATAFVGRTDEEKEVIKIQQKNNQDAIREFWRMMQGADAILVMNLSWFSRNWRMSAGALRTGDLGQLRFLRHGGML